jgi:hypothetical protein
MVQAISHLPDAIQMPFVIIYQSPLFQAMALSKVFAFVLPLHTPLKIKEK